MEVGAADRAGFHRNADLAWSRRRQRALFHDERSVHRVENHRLHGIASMKCGVYPPPEGLDLAEVGRAPPAMRLPEIGDQLVLAGTVHIPALDHQQIAPVGDIEVSQGCEQRLKLGEDLRIVDPITFLLTWSLANAHLG